MVCIFGAACSLHLVRLAIAKGLPHVIVYVNHEAVAGPPFATAGLSIENVDGQCRYASDSTGQKTEPNPELDNELAVPLLGGTAAYIATKKSGADYKAITSDFKVIQKT